MGVFEHFPYVNYHELNLSWILRKLKELENVIGSQIVDIVARAGVAENAQAIADLTDTVEENATTAHNEAAAASQAAAVADTKATNAASAASAAQTTANSAVSAAAAAQTTADNAAKFIEIGSLVNEATSTKEALIRAFEKITITGKPVIGHYTYSGAWTFIGYKYPDGTYGVLLAMTYYPSANSILLLNRDNGTDTVRPFTLSTPI